MRHQRQPTSLLSLCLVLFGATLTSCDSGSRTPEFVDLGSVPIPSHTEFSPAELSGVVLNSDTILGKPGLLAVNGSILWVVDFAGSPWLHAIDGGDGHLIQSFGPRGEGPGEFQSVLGVSAAGPTNDVWAFDPSSEKMTRLDSSSRIMARPRIVSLDVPGRVTRAIAFGSTGFIAMQMANGDSGHILLTSSEGRVTHSSAWPLLGADSVPRLERLKASGAAFSASLCAPPDGSALALVYSSAGRVDIFDAMGRHLRAAEVPFPSQPVFSTGRDGGLKASRPRYWYSGCAATPRHIYALFAGRLESAFTATTVGLSEFVHQFDWSGKLVRVVHLDQPVSAIAVSADERTLYAVSEESATVVKFVIP